MGFQQVVKELGVDDALPVPWMMVPHDGFNLAMLLPADGLTLVPDNKNLITISDGTDPRNRHALEILLGAVSFVISSATRLVVVSGKKTAGDTFVKAVDSRGREKARLDVSVKVPRPVKVVFNFVRHLDSSGKPVNHTSKDPSMADQWIAGMNAIYTPQSNVVFQKQEARWVQYNKQFDRIIRPLDYEELFKKRIEGDGLMNFFIVGEYERDNNRRSTVDNYKGGTVNYKNIICEDIGDKEKHSMAVLLAHEALHFLLREDHHDFAKDKAHWLMEQWDTQTGYKIPKHQANKLNPTVAPRKAGKK